MKVYLVAFAVFLGIDAIWLLVIAKNLYTKAIGHLMSTSPNLWAALMFYLLFVYGIIHFVISPHITQNATLQQTLINAALFGLICYATYDLTNLATLKEWPLYVTIIDLAWGALLSTTTTYISLKILEKF